MIRARDCAMAEFLSVGSIAPFQGFVDYGGIYTQGVALGCIIFSLSGWA